MAVTREPAVDLSEAFAQRFPRSLALAQVPRRSSRAASRTTRG